MSKGKLLVVDDDKDFVVALAGRLDARGFETIKAFDGKEGLEKVYAEKPDAIILDVTMPDINGFDVCKKLKTDENCKEIPIIMLTGRSNPEDVKLAKDMGADAYFTKPFELDMLLYEVYALLRMKKKKSTEERNPGLDGK